VIDTGAKGITGHAGSDGSTPETRLTKYGTAKGAWSVSQCYGQQSATATVMKLLIDDGVPNRAHRKSIFDKNFKLFGSFSG
jgi:uncharacterized protein YkwD